MVAQIQNSIMFKADNTYQPRDKNQVPVQTKLYMPMNRDMYEKMQAEKKEKNKQAWYKAGIIGGCVLAAAFATQAIIAVATYKTNKKVAEASIRSMEAQTKHLSNADKHGEEIKNAIKNVFEDISKADKIDDLALSKELTEFINTFKNSVENPEMVLERGGDFINSILFYGPPGTGKTTIAKAIAQMFPKSKFASLDVTKMKDKYVGETEKNVNKIIDAICKEADEMMARYNNELSKIIGKELVEKGTPAEINKAIIKAQKEGKKMPEMERVFAFLDEIDSVMMVDTSSSAKYSNDMLNEFKKGVTEKLGKRKNIVMIGATNLEINAEKAMTKDGKMLDKPMLDRFNMKIYVGNPLKEQLKKTIVRKMSNLSLVSDELKDINSAKLDTLCQFLEGSTSYRDLNAILKATGNRVKLDASGKVDTTSKTTVLDMFETIKTMKESLGFGDDIIENLGRNLGLAA